MVKLNIKLLSLLSQLLFYLLKIKIMVRQLIFIWKFKMINFNHLTILDLIFYQLYLIMLHFYYFHFIFNFTLIFSKIVFKSKQFLELIFFHHILFFIFLIFKSPKGIDIFIVVFIFLVIFLMVNLNLHFLFYFSLKQYTI